MESEKFDKLCDKHNLNGAWAKYLGVFIDSCPNSDPEYLAKDVAQLKVNSFFRKEKKRHLHIVKDSREWREASGQVVDNGEEGDSQFSSAYVGATKEQKVNKFIEKSTGKRIVE